MNRNSVEDIAFVSVPHNAAGWKYEALSILKDSGDLCITLGTDDDIECIVTKDMDAVFSWIRQYWRFGKATNDRKYDPARAVAIKGNYMSCIMQGQKDIFNRIVKTAWEEQCLTEHTTTILN